MLLTGLDWKYFNWHQMEFHGRLNLLKTGLVFADAITTVSPRYAQEIQTPELGYGLEGVLQYRRDVLFGILNGINVDQWNPADDEHLDCGYDADSVGEGKPRCKAALQEEVGLPVRADVPLAGVIGRLCDQKGFDLLADVIERWGTAGDLQWVVLGTGEPKFHRLFQSLAERHRDRVAVRLEFSGPLSRRIEAGADMFVMPSRYEPCGLNQLYSLRYGTVPVVRETGGLADTITDTTPQTLADGTANGFRFQEYSPQALDEAMSRAYDAYRRPQVWSQLVSTGMRQDWSWAHSAKEYVKLYQETIARKNQAVTT